MVFKTSLKVLSSLGLAVLLYFFGFQQGCSPVLFDSLEPLSCDEFPEGSNCEMVRVELPPEQDRSRQDQDEKTRDRESKPPAPAVRYVKYNYEITLGKVAFLFVLDISSSTAIEHRSLGQQLSPFLKSIKYLKYHVGLITMDISASPNNPVRNAYYQDGKLIPIAGQPYLTNPSLGDSPPPAVIASFQKALEREETRRCDIKNQPKKSGDKYDRYYEGDQRTIPCPSSDERGTYAMNLAIRNPAYREFFNRDHVLFIPVTDEDIRSGAEFYNQPGFEEYRPESLDQPETLVDTISATFPRSRTFSFHPIIIPPGDEACLREQNKNRDGGPGSGRGYYGKLYAELVRPNNFLSLSGNFLRGSVISICDRNYKSQLAQVSLFAQTSKIPLPCFEPEYVHLFANGRRVESDYNIEGRSLYMRSKGTLALSSKVEVEVLCKEKNQLDTQ